MAQIENSTFMFRLRAIVANVTAKARSHIEDVDTNSVERFNSVVAKYVGGKGSISRKGRATKQDVPVL